MIGQPQHLLATQGGGYAVYSYLDQTHVWWSVPAWLVLDDGTQPGDPIPEEWGLASTNKTTMDVRRGVES